MLGVNFGFSLGPFRYIWVFGIAFSGDAMILDAGVNADAARENIWLDIVVIQIVANVAIELAVIVVSRIAVPRTPYLPGRIRITPERGDPGWAMHRRMNAVAGPFVRTCNPVCFQDRKSNSHLIEQRVHAGEVSALREPETGRHSSKTLPVLLHADFNLRPYRRLVDREQGQIPVRRGAGNDLQITKCLEPMECAKQVFFVTMDERLVNASKQRLVHASKRGELRIRPRACDFLVRQFD